MPKPRHVHEIYIKAPAEQVWQAITDPSMTAGYYFGCVIESTWEPGSPYRYVVGGPDGDMDAIVGEIKEIEPGRRLVMSFTMAYDPEAAAEEPTTVIWEITPVGEAISRLTLIHQDFHGSSSKTWSNTLTGWTHIISGIKTLVETGSPIGDIPDERAGQPAADLDGQLHREQAITANNSVWELLDMAERTAHDDEDMVRRAYAAAYHWARAVRRGPENEARASWLLSRVHAVLGRGDVALHHAQRCAAACATGGLGDFDLAYAHEATARALACLGRLDEAATALVAARGIPIVDAEDRAVVEGDLVAEPWFELVVDG